MAPSAEKGALSSKLNRFDANKSHIGVGCLLDKPSLPRW